MGIHKCQNSLLPRRHPTSLESRDPKLDIRTSCWYGTALGSMAAEVPATLSQDHLPQPTSQSRSMRELAAFTCSGATACTPGWVQRGLGMGRGRACSQRWRAGPGGAWGPSGARTAPGPNTLARPPPRRGARPAAAAGAPAGAAPGPSAPGCPPAGPCAPPPPAPPAPPHTYMAAWNGRHHSSFSSCRARLVYVALPEPWAGCDRSIMTRGHRGDTRVGTESSTCQWQCND